jgi:hypothetical protein
LHPLTQHLLGQPPQKCALLQARKVMKKNHEKANDPSFWAKGRRQAYKRAQSQEKIIAQLEVEREAIRNSPATPGSGDPWGMAWDAASVPKPKHKTKKEKLKEAKLKQAEKLKKREEAKAEQLRQTATQKEPENEEQKDAQAVDAVDAAAAAESAEAALAAAHAAEEDKRQAKERTLKLAQQSGMLETAAAVEALLGKQAEDKMVGQLAARAAMWVAKEGDELAGWLKGAPAAVAALERAGAAQSTGHSFWRERWVDGLSLEEAEAIAAMAEWSLAGALEGSQGSDLEAGAVVVRGQAGKVPEGVRADRARYAVDPKLAFPILSTVVDVRTVLGESRQPKCKAEKPLEGGDSDATPCTPSLATVEKAAETERRASGDVIVEGSGEGGTLSTEGPSLFDEWLVDVQKELPGRAVEKAGGADGVAGWAAGPGEAVTVSSGEGVATGSMCPDVSVTCEK